MAMKRERAYVEGRRKQILALMKENPAVRVDELAEKFQVSLITIRRDLQYLEEKNLLVRFYGGAVSAKAEKKEDGEISVYRNLIAKYAASLVEPGDSLFINSSRNALQILTLLTRICLQRTETRLLFTFCLLYTSPSNIG